jgi:Cohesin domain
MKKRQKVVFICLALLLVNVSAKAAFVVSVQTSEASANIGDLVTATLNIAGVSDLYAYQADLDFNPGLLQATSVNEGTFLPSGGTTLFLPGTIDNTLGAITNNADTLLGAVSGVNGSGSLLIATFDATASGPVNVTFSNLLLLDSSLNPITNTITPEPSTRLPMAILALGTVTAICIRRSRFARKSGV